MKKVLKIIISPLFLLALLCSCSSTNTSQYFGVTGFKTHSTGFFRVEQIDGRWYFITPEGHLFFSSGINTIKFDGTATRSGKYPFRENNLKKYGTPGKWSIEQTRRLKKWGWNTLGAWSDWKLFRKKIPYTVILYIGGSNWTKGTITDCFDPDFRLQARKRLLEFALPLKDDPWLLGYFLDNEIRWGPDHRGGHIFDDYFALPSDKPGKKALIAFLQKYYKSIQKLKKDFQTDAHSWEKLAQSTSIAFLGDSNALTIKRIWSGKVADTFFKTLNEELKAVDPNHLNLGVRFIAQTLHPQVLQAAGKHMDVVSINYYYFNPEVLEKVKRLDPEYLPTSDCLAEHYKICKRPILISEFGFRAADSGLPNTWPPVYPVYKTQTDRAAAFEKYASQALNTTWIIGFHWFEFSDQPEEGRFDGENNNWGLVNIQDDPYQSIIIQSQKIKHNIINMLSSP